LARIPAQRLGWTDRGLIRKGSFADLVLFNADTVIDHATFEHPTELSSGIETVLANGEIVWAAGQPTGARPGRVLPR
jgi:N-acyl-D-amino-acid deacylase